MPIGLVPMFGPIAPDEAVQTSHDSIGRSEPTMSGSRIARPNMTMLGVDSERAYSSILRFTPRTEALFALSRALLLPSSVASQEAVIRAFTAALGSLLRLMTMRRIAPVESLIPSEAILRDSILG